MSKFFLSAITALGLVGVTGTAAENPLIGVVNFASCIAESKAGKKEQENIYKRKRERIYEKKTIAITPPCHTVYTFYRFVFYSYKFCLFF